MNSNLPSRMHSACTRRFQPYARVSTHSLRSLEARDVQELERGIKASLESHRLETRRRSGDVNIRMGSAMDIDLPLNSSNGTYGCVDTTMEDDKIGPLAVVPTENNGPRKRLVRGLQKAVDKYLQRHLDGNNPRTNQVRERMHIALQAALLGIDVDEIMVHKQSHEQTQTNKGGNNTWEDQTTDDYLIPSAIAHHILDGVFEAGL
ncbi:hypothetical protein F4604DRAFT_1937376 [Suillus subluteus]|nr:hypothetical protein F4604DRAFT_1937376 [Suillus subluteus]